jgi:hypothetical protein
VNETQQALLDGFKLGATAIWQGLILGFPDMAAEAPILWTLPALIGVGVIASVVRLFRS